MTHAPVVLGLDFGGTKVACRGLLRAGQGTGSASATVSTALPSFGAGASFDQGHPRGPGPARERGAGCGARRRRGASTFGIPFDDRVELAPAISGWDKLPLGQELRAAFPGAEIRMATDAKAAALAEVRWGSLAGYDPAVYLTLGTGLSAALVDRRPGHCRGQWRGQA